MKNPLAVFAFKHVTQHKGITALLETALSAVDSLHNRAVAEHVSLALDLLDRQTPDPLDLELAQISSFG